LFTNDWKNVLLPLSLNAYWDSLNTNLIDEIDKYIIYPPTEKIFNAFNLCSFHETKVVIIGQDPYHQKGQAEGLSFSVAQGVAFPPSLKNIFKEIDLEYNQINFRSSGSLVNWAKQGVLLLNACLTVRESEPNSHVNLGWQELTKNAVQVLSDRKENLVFLLWGNFAHKFENLIDAQKHLIIKTAHPSPLGANKGGWFGSNCFKNANEYLEKNQINPIDWNI